MQRKNEMHLLNKSTTQRLNDSTTQHFNISSFYRCKVIAYILL